MGQSLAKARAEWSNEAIQRLTPKERQFAMHRDGWAVPSLSLRDLHTLPSQSRIVTLECAGNGRTLFQPPIEGEKWNLGAVSTAEWTGVPLREVLDRAGVRPGALEVLFRGADGGTVEGRPGPIRFERSLPLDQAREADLLLAYAMNGEPLPIQHGYPVRLVVPGWYAVASVKWLTEIQLIDRPFTGHYQADKYWYESRRDGQIAREPVMMQRVRALITEPSPDYKRCRFGSYEAFASREAVPKPFELVALR